jgi:hypothetical protein
MDPWSVLAAARRPPEQGLLVRDAITSTFEQRVQPLMELGRSDRRTTSTR